MNSPKLTFEQVRGILQTIPNINSGGCSISMLAMFKWLAKNGLYKPNTKFVYLYRYDDHNQYVNNKAILRDKSSGSKINASSCAHAVLLYEGVYYDSDGVVIISNYQFVEHISDEEFTMQSINNKVWNTTFSRSFIQLIEQKLDIQLNIRRT